MNSMHLSLNSLLISRELFASNAYSLPQAPDFIELEIEEIWGEFDNNQSRIEYRTDYGIKRSDIASLIDLPFGTQFKGGQFTEPAQDESLTNLLPVEELVSPLRKNTVHTLISRFLGTLEMAEPDVFDIFVEYRVNFNRPYWSNLLKV